MINLVWSGILILSLLSGCGFDGTPTRHNDFVPLTSIEITAVSPSIAAKTSTKLSVIGHYSGLFTRDITDQAAWKSGNMTVAEFMPASSPNRVTGHAPGIATLTATVGSVSATYSLTVSPATIKNMTITPANPSVATGLTTQFAVNGTFSDSTTQDLTFDATWTPITGTIATVSNDPASKGRAKGLAVGTVTITASFDGFSGTSQLNVTAALLQLIAVTPANSSIAGFPKTVNFIATGTYSDGTTADVTTTVTWDSSQKNIATIATPGGVATTIAAGTTSISATLDGVNGATNFTVTALALSASGLKIAPVSQILTVGARGSFTVTATFTDGTTQNVTASCVWASTAPTIATVGNTATDKGLVIGGAAGSTTITATYGGQTTTATVTIQ